MKITYYLPFVIVLFSFTQIYAQRTGGYKPMTQQEWFGYYKKYMAESTELKTNTNADKHFNLGKWAWEHGLEDEAWEQWLIAIKYDKDHSKSYEAMGFEKKGNEWVRPGEVNEKWLTEVKKKERALSYTFAFEDDVDDEFFEEFSWRIRRLNWFIWHLTEGQMYLENVKLIDKNSDGRFLIEKGRLHQTLLTGGGAVCYNSGRKDWYVKSGGRCYMRILCHEFFHGIFGLPDERHGCFCIMQGGLYGIKSPDLKLCDKESHRESTVTPISCWELIIDRYPDMEHNDKDRGKAPEVNIEIIDK